MGSKRIFNDRPRKQLIKTRVPARRGRKERRDAPMPGWWRSCIADRMHRHLIAVVAASLMAACGPGAPATGAHGSAAAASTDRAARAPRMPAAGLYVTNEKSGNLTVIDLATLTPVATIPLGKRPRGIAASPDGSRLYVALSGSPAAGPGVDESKLPPPDRSADGIGVVDLDQGKLVTVIRSGTDPEQLTVSPDGTRVFVANEDAAQLTVLDVASGAMAASYKVGAEPEGVTVQPGTNRVWVTSEDAGAVYVIDLDAKKVVGSVPVGPRPRSIAFLPDGSRAYVPSENGGTLTEIDVKRLKPIRTIRLGEGIRPMGTRMSRDGRRLYVSTGRSRKVFVLDTTTDRIVSSVDAGPRPWGIALAPDGARLFTANGPSNDVSVIDVAGGRVEKKIPAGSGPWGVAVVTRRPPGP
jgi:YVTN family beta-propeller protein